MADVSVKNYSGDNVTYKSVPKIWLSSPEAPDDPERVIPFTYGEAVGKVVEPDFSGGDMAVPIAEGELVTALTVVKPETLTPENIAKDVEIAGVVGTHEGGGGEGGGETVTDEETVDFLDYDGTLVASYPLSKARALASLPEPPTHNGLVFQGWNHTLEEIRGASHMLDVGATYITDDGKTRFYITVWDASVAVRLYYSQSVASGVTIDWGDGTAPTSSATAGNTLQNHTYPETGDYVITLAVEDGCVLGFANGTRNTRTFYTNYEVLFRAHIGKNVESIGLYAFSDCKALEYITIPEGVTSVGDYAFYFCESLECAVIPKGAVSVGDSAFTPCYRLKRVSFPAGATIGSAEVFKTCYALERVVFPHGVTSFGNNYFQNCLALKEVYLPDSVTSLGDYCFSGCHSLLGITLPDSVTTTGKYCFQSYSMRKISFPETMTSIGTYCIYNCYNVQSISVPKGIAAIPDYFVYNVHALKTITIPEGVVTIGQRAFNSCECVEKITIPEGVTTINTYAFYSTDAKIIVLPSTLTTVASSAFGDMPGVKIYAPDDKVATYKGLSGFSSVKTHILPLSSMPTN